MIGRILKGRYRLQETIGRGGTGVVFRALDLIADRPVAVKTLHGLASGDAASLRFQREAQALSTLDHPNIVSILDVGEEDGLHFIVMEYLAGRSLRSMIPLSIPVATEIILQICSALEYAHTRGIIHRDIKPENVMVLEGEAPPGTVTSLLTKLMDFGLAIRTAEQRHVTESGAILGTVAYFSPEQALGMRADARSDLYSLGAMFYEMLTGRELFPGKNLISVIFQHVDEPPVPPRRYNPEISPGLERVILRLLKKEPSERFASAAELQVALREACEGSQPSFSTELSLPSPSSGAPVFASTFIGREKDLSFLRSLLRASAGGAGSLVLIGGEPGVGKTRLVQELLAYARLRRASVLSGTCYEQEAGLPYQPFVDAIRSYVQTIGSQRPESIGKASQGFERELSMLVPEIRTPADVPGESRLASVGEPEKSRLFEAVRCFVCRLGEENGTVLFLDDLQWADAATLQLLHYVARQLTSEKVLVVGTYRDTEPGTLLTTLMTQLNREKLFHQIILERLTPDEARKLIVSLLGGGDLADDLLDRIYAETEGNAFFIVETVQHLAEEASVKLVGGQWRGAVTAQPSLPSGVRDVISRRLARLGAEVQHVLGVAAVVGREFGFDTLLQVTGRSEDTLLEAIEEALKARLIREKPLRREDRYDFSHGKIREVLYRELSGRRRRMLHRAIGQALENLGERRGEQVAGELAYHFAQSGDTEKAIDYGLRAGAQALSVYATEDAARHFGEVVRLIDELGGHPRAAEAFTRLGESCMILGRFGDALEAYQKAFGLANEDPALHGAGLARLHDATGMVHERLGHYDEALRHLFAGLQCLPAGEEGLEAARLHGHLGVVLSRKGRYEEAEEHSLRGLRLAELLQNDEEVASACTILTHLSMLRAEWADAIRYTMRALEIWQRKNDVYRQASNYLNLGVSLWPLGRWQEAAQYWEKALQISNEIHYATGQMQSHINLGNYSLRTGDTAKAGEHYRVALRVAENTGHSYYAARALLRLGEQHRVEGDLMGSVTLLTRAKENLESIGHTVGLSEVLWNLAETLLVQGDLEEAIAAATQSLELVESHQSVEEIANAKRVLATVYARLGKAEKARALYLGSLEAFQKLGDVYELARARLDYCRFLLGRQDESEESSALLSAAHAAFAATGALREKRDSEALLSTLFPKEQVSGDPS